MLNLSNHDLIEAYYSALELNLDEEFILLLEEEIDNRSLRSQLTAKVAQE